MRAFTDNSYIKNTVFSGNRRKSIIRCLGFSLMEAMVSIAILAILASIAAPSFASVIAKNQLKTLSSDLTQTLNLARQYALSNQAIVQVCRLSEANQNQCHQQYKSNSSWSLGWLVFHDVNQNNKLDQQDRVIRSVQNKGRTNVVFNQRGRLRFFANGSARSSGFYLCDTKKANYRHVRLLHTGRVRVTDEIDDKNKAICDRAREII